MSTLNGKVAIVTGSGSGIGQATAEVLAERGASVVVAGINAEASEAVAAGIRERGQHAVAVATDVSDEAQIQHLVVTAVSTFGGVDILHNNAALLSADVIARDTQITDIDAALFERVLRVNVIGYTLAAKHVIPQMISRGGAVVINTSSAAGVLGELSRPMYGTSPKAAIIGTDPQHRCRIRQTRYPVGRDRTRDHPYPRCAGHGPTRSTRSHHPPLPHPTGRAPG
jgi:NAD(P)-dependent dehydrogenase (short-subunit alcohol dehydrogenase family)